MSNSNVKRQKPRLSNLIVILKKHLPMSYENQLLFYKETLKHRNKKYVFTIKLQNFLCSLLQRASMIHAVELHASPSVQKHSFLQYSFLPLYFIRGKRQEQRMAHDKYPILTTCPSSFLFFSTAFHFNAMSFSFREIFLAQWYPFRNMNVPS